MCHHPTVISISVSCQHGAVVGCQLNEKRCLHCIASGCFRLVEKVQQNGEPLKNRTSNRQNGKNQNQLYVNVESRPTRPPDRSDDSQVVVRQRSPEFVKTHVDTILDTYGLHASCLSMLLCYIPRQVHFGSAPGFLRAI